MGTLLRTFLANTYRNPGTTQTPSPKGELSCGFGACTATKQCRDGGIIDRPRCWLRQRALLTRDQANKERTMKSMAIAVALLVGMALVPAGSAQAAGCLKGAAVGGVAGHFANHHGLIGAGVGCLVGRHEANKHVREQVPQDRYYH
jgi:hypothetical protein